MFWAKKIKILLGFGAVGPKHNEIFFVFFAQKMLSLALPTDCKEAVCPNLT